jgi:hypothetical protein
LWFWTINFAAQLEPIVQRICFIKRFGLGSAKKSGSKTPLNLLCQPKGMQI